MKDPYHLAQRVLRRASHGALATLSVEQDGWPFASAVNLVAQPDGCPAFLISGLAEHTRNLRADPRASLLVVDPYAPAEGAPRLSLMGHAEPVTLDALAQARFVRLHPAAEQYLSFGDFSFWQLRPERLRLIGGFGAAGWVTGSRYCHAPALSLADEAHLLAELGGEMANGNTLLGVDAYGVDGCDGNGQRWRDQFNAPCASAEAVRAAWAGRRRCGRD